MKFAKIVCLLLVAILGIGVLASCATVDEGNTVLDNEALTYVSLRINPEIELLVDKDGIVVSADAVNEDGEVVLSTADLEGKSVEEAGSLFVETAEELGYFTPDGENDTVYIDVESTVEGEDTVIEEKRHKCICDHFKKKGINGKVSQETLEKYAEKAAEWDIPVGLAKLVLRVLDAHPELTDEEVLELSPKEMLQLLKGKKGEDKIDAGLKPEYCEGVETLKSEFAKLFELRKEIEELKASLEGELTDEEKSAVEAQIAEKEAELKALHEEYKAKVDELRESFHEASKEAKKGHHAEAERRRNEHKGKPSRPEKPSKPNAR